jgi:hypothetical protein
MSIRIQYNAKVSAMHWPGGGYEIGQMANFPWGESFHSVSAELVILSRMQGRYRRPAARHLHGNQSYGSFLSVLVYCSMTPVDRQPACSVRPW